jgi:hypothetical protein
MTLIAMHNIDVGSKPALHHPGFQKMHSGTLRRPETSQAYLTRLSVIPNPQSPIPPPNSFVLHFRALYSIKVIIDSFCRAHRMFFASTTSSQLSCLLACWSFLYPVTSVKQQLNQQPDAIRHRTCGPSGSTFPCLLLVTCPSRPSPAPEL